MVALRKESVDRNDIPPNLDADHAVALRKESVDRNNGRLRAVQNTKVALRKESVDRNTCTLLLVLILQRSLSARRAWIEIYVQRRIEQN